MFVTSSTQIILIIPTNPRNKGAGERILNGLGFRSRHANALLPNMSTSQLDLCFNTVVTAQSSKPLGATRQILGKGATASQRLQSANWVLRGNFFLSIKIMAAEL